MQFSEERGKITFSGAENHLFVLLDNLCRLGIDTELIAIVTCNGPAIDQKLSSLRDKGITVTIVNAPESGIIHKILFPNVPWFIGLWKTLISRRNRLIHIHLNPVYMVLAAQLARCPYIFFSLHNDDPAFIRLKWRLWFRFINSSITHYIAITKWVKEYHVSTLGIAPDKISVIYYGLELAQPRKSRNQLREQFGIPLDAYVVGFIGRLTEQKNVPLFIEAVSRIPDIKGIIVGGGELEQALKAMVRKSNITNVLFLGPHHNADELMEMFDIFCLPSIFEGLGLVLIEAMLSKVPVIGSRAGAIPEILGNGSYGALFNSNDPADLIRALREMRNNQSYDNDFVLKAYKHATEAFSIDAMMKRTIEVYRKELH